MMTLLENMKNFLENFLNPIPHDSFFQYDRNESSISGTSANVMVTIESQ